MSEQTPPEVSRPSTPDAELPKLAFTDADSAKRWAHGLPLTNVALVCETVQSQLRALSAATFSPRERATLAEILRDLIAYLHTELARRYAGKGQPAADRELEAAAQAIALWFALWEQYSFCLKPLIEGDPELSGVKPKILQRGLYVGKQLILAHALARQSVPASLWQEINAYYRLSEVLDCAVAAVSDDLLPNAVGISCYSTYTHALLLGLADPWMMTVKQIELTDRWLAMWARKVFPYAAQRDTEGPLVLIDLDGGSGATLVASAPVKPSPSMRFGYPAKLATSVHGRINRLQSGATPAELQLGQDCSVEQCSALLVQLELRWCQVPRRPTDTPRSMVDLCAGGLPAAYFRVGGRTLEKKETHGHSTFQDAQELRAQGDAIGYDRGRDEAEHAWPWEQWEGKCELREARLVRTSDARHRWSLEQLAIVRHDGQLRAGFVTRVSLTDETELALALRLWPGVANSLALKPLSTGGSSDAQLPALILAASLEDHACLVLPPRTFNPSRVLRLGNGGPPRRFRLTRLMQRGIDFERIAFEETD